MKIESGKENIIVWMDDGTEVIFSLEATEDIKKQMRESQSEDENLSFEQAIYNELLNVTVPSLIEEEPQKSEDIDEMNEDILEIILNIQKDILEREQRFVEEIISIRNDLLELVRVVNTNTGLLEKHIKESSRRKK